MTQEQLPVAMVGPEVDLRDFSYMPLDVVRLRDSELAATPDAEAFRCCVLAWCVSWHQVPAASLPDDDAQLARLLGFGRDIKGWKRVREKDGLRGWIKCDDGRLYHPVVTEKALDAWAAKCAQRARTASARAAREAERQRQLEEMLHSQSQTKDASVTDNVTSSKGRESKGKGEGKGDIGDTEVGAGAAASPSAPRAKGMRLPDGWVLPKRWGDWALCERLDWDAEDVRKCAERFADHWHAAAGQSARKLDWEATWRNWVRKEPSKFAAKGSTRLQPGVSKEAGDEAERMIFGGANATV